MTDLDQILPLWRELRDAGTEYVLATVVAVEGSGYRKSGARMLIGADGRRAGTISGGCLEGEVARKAFWHTEHGPVTRRYSTSADDGEVPFGMGCGGIVHLLLERSATASPLIERLSTAFEERRSLAIATVLEGDWIGNRGYASLGPDEPLEQSGILVSLNELAAQSSDAQHSFTQSIQAEDGQVATVWSEWRDARPGLFIFGAGDDAIPLVKIARQLGWYVTVADGRSHLATQVRFPDAHDVVALPTGSFPSLDLRNTDAAVVMTHSIEQDGRILGELIGQDLAYLGVLGPRRRTSEILLSLAKDRNIPLYRVDAQVELWISRLHAPIGLDLGGDTPADIALATIAEIQMCIRNASGIALRQIQDRTLDPSSMPQS